MAPALIMIVLLTLSVALNAFWHGESRGEYHMGLALIATAITVMLLWWGNYWAPLGWPA